MLSPTPSSITQTRERLGLTKTQLGRQLGVSDSTISKWESGRNKPDEKNAMKLIQWLGAQNTLYAIDQRFGPEEYVHPPAPKEPTPLGKSAPYVKPTRHIDKWDVLAGVVVTGTFIGLVVLLVLIATETV